MKTLFTILVIAAGSYLLLSETPAGAWLDEQLAALTHKDMPAQWQQEINQTFAALSTRLRQSQQQEIEALKAQIAALRFELDKKALVTQRALQSVASSETPHAVADANPVVRTDANAPAETRTLAAGALRKVQDSQNQYLDTQYLDTAHLQEIADRMRQLSARAGLN